MTVKATNNGVEIKALKGFEGMEGWTYQGNLRIRKSLRGVRTVMAGLWTCLQWNLFFQRINLAVYLQT